MSISNSIMSVIICKLWRIKVIRAILCWILSPHTDEKSQNNQNVSFKKFFSVDIRRQQQLCRSRRYKWNQLQILTGAPCLFQGIYPWSATLCQHISTIHGTCCGEGEVSKGLQVRIKSGSLHSKPFNNLIRYRTDVQINVTFPNWITGMNNDVETLL